MSATCDHAFPGRSEGWPCIRRRCLDEADRAYSRAARQAIRAAAAAAARTPEDDLLDHLRQLWDRYPGQREIIAALASYAEALDARRAA